MLTIFTIPRAFEGETAMYQGNAIQSWLHSIPGCEVLLCGDENGVAEAAAAWQVRHLPHIEKNAYGTPLLHDAFAQAARAAAGDTLAYLNADIVLLSDPGAAYTAIPFRRYLLTGRRWNMKMPAALDFEDDGWRRTLRETMHKEGSLGPADALDLFLYPRSVSWPMPAFAVGRPGWDNWMVYAARTHGLPVVDATEALPLVHPIHGYTHVKERSGARWEGPEGERNRALAGAGRTGTLDDATHRLRNGRVERIGKRYRLYRELDILEARFPAWRAVWRAGHGLVAGGERLRAVTAGRGNARRGAAP